MTRRADEKDIAVFFDRKAGCCAPERLGWRPTDRPTRVLEDAVLAGGVTGKSVLELGCGTGELIRDLVRAGASRGTGVDISPNSVARARGAAEADGLADRLRFETGNAGTARLEQHDIVVLDKVICCYADVEQLLANSVPAAGETYAFSMPRTDGLWSLFTRTWIALENAGHALRRRRFRAYGHDARLVHERLSEAGFRVARRRPTLGWLVAVYERS